MYIPVHADGVYYSPIRQQWCVAFNQSGYTKDLHVWSWHSSNLEALQECKRKTQFRMGLHVDQTPWYAHLERIEKEISKLEKSKHKERRPHAILHGMQFR
jgi:hypothetical protein